MLPFDVPAGTTSVRVKYCYEDQPDGTRRRPRPLAGPRRQEAVGRGAVPRLGRLEPPRRDDHAAGLLDGGGVRGGAEGPRRRAARRAASCPVRSRPAAGRRSSASRAVVARREARTRRPVDWRVEIELARGSRLRRRSPTCPRPTTRRPRTPRPGWYAGDMHVHAEHSALGDATMTETFDYAFRSLADGGAGLDFITLSDYVTPTRLGRDRPLPGRVHPGKLIIRSSEVITYRGHTNNHASLRYVDHRTGPVYELSLPGGELRRAAQGPRSAHDLQGGARGGRLDAAQPRDDVPVLGSSVLPAHLPRLPVGLHDEGDEAPAGRRDRGRTTASRFRADQHLHRRRDRLLGGARSRAAQRITAVGSSDSHHAGGGDAPIGDRHHRRLRAGALRARHRATRVRAGPRLREDRSGNAVAGPAPRGPRRRAARTPPAIMGDDDEGRRPIDFAAAGARHRRRGGALQLVVVKDGEPIETVPVAARTADAHLHLERPGPLPRSSSARGEAILVAHEPDLREARQVGAAARRRCASTPRRRVCYPSAPHVPRGHVPRDPARDSRRAARVSRPHSATTRS